MTTGKPDEPFADGPFADELGAEIRDAVACYAPEPDEFAVAVRAAVERQEARGVVIPLPAFVRQAASLLPPILLPAALAKTGLAATSAVAKKAAWKAVPGLAVLPAAVAIMVVVTFFYGLTGSFVATKQAHRRDAARAEVAAWWKRNAWLAALVVALLIAIALRAPAEAIFAFFGVSMLCLIGIVGALGRAGFASRREIGERCAGFLFALLPYVFMTANLTLFSLAIAPWTIPVSICALALAACVCLAIGSGRGSKRAVLSYGLAAVICLLSLSLSVIGRVAADRTDAVTLIESWTETRSTASWDDIAAILVNLRADGGPTPNVSNARQTFHDDVDDILAGGAGINPLMVRELEAVGGFFRPQDYDVCRDDYWETRDLARVTPFGSVRHVAFHLAVFARYHHYAEEERVRLASRVFAGLAKQERHDDLEDLVLRTRMLDALGFRERCEELRPAVHEALRATWAGGPGTTSGCFAPSYDLIERDAAGVPVETRFTFVWLDSSELALRLLGRYGVPDGIDLAAFDRYLREMANGYRRVRGVTVTAALAAAMRSRLRTLREWSERDEASVWEELGELRVLIGALLLALLCVVVTVRAPETARVGVTATGG